MAVNAARYGLITQEYRYREVYNSTIDGRYAKAREMTIDTELDVALITSLLVDMFGVIGAVRRRFVVEVKGCDLLTISNFAGNTPTFTLTSADLGVTSLLVLATRVVIDEEQDMTTIEVWG